MNPQAMSGMMVGISLMFVFGAVWIFIGGYRGPLPTSLRAVLVLVGLMLATWILITGFRVAHLARTSPPLTAEQITVGRQIGRRFGWISGAEGVAIFLAVVALNLARRPDLILSTIALIVGLHFLPLANLFHEPVYYITGLIGGAIGVIGLRIRDRTLRDSVVGLSFGLLLWLTDAVVLAFVSRSV